MTVLDSVKHLLHRDDHSKDEGTTEEGKEHHHHHHHHTHGESKDPTFTGAGGSDPTFTGTGGYSNDVTSFGAPASGKSDVMFTGAGAPTGTADPPMFHDASGRHHHEQHTPNFVRDATDTRVGSSEEASTDHYHDEAGRSVSRDVTDTI